MKRNAVTVSLAFGLAAAQNGSVETWAPGGPTDFRGPCPMMNTLANHGFLPHDGNNLTEEVVVNALKNGLNFDPSLGAIMFSQALVANPEPNATFFTLDMLNRHNVLEHDASISRTDAAFGNNHVFNQTVFDTSRQFFNSDPLTAQSFANAKIFRQLVSRSTNPHYTFSTTTEAFSLGEMAAPIIVFGDMTEGTVNKSMVEFFFENERLPAELGWTKKTDAVTLEQISAVSQMVENATYLFTPAAGSSSAARRHSVTFSMNDLHLGTGKVN